MASSAPSASVMAPGAAAPTTEAMMDFLKSGIDMMNSEATRKLLLECPDPGQKLIELQRQGWDPLGVDRDIGCKCLDEIGPQSSDPSLNQAKQEFVHTAMRTFLKTLEDKKPATLQTCGPIPREKIIGFTDACNTKMDLPETMMAMQQYAMQNQQPPGQVVIELQRDMLETFGIEREHGCMRLSEIPKDYPDDKELLQRMMMWKTKSEQMCMMIWRRAASKLAPMTQILEKQLSSPEVKEDADKARERLKSMSLEDQEAHIQLMQHKMQGLQSVMHLPKEQQQETMKKLDVDQGDVVLSQVIMLKRMTERMKQDRPEQQSSAGAGSSSAPAASTAAAPTARPPSQMMM